MFHSLRTFLELIRFSHTIFAMPYALTSAALAWRTKGRFDWIELVGILACLVFARSAAMGFNRLADRHIDAKNPRTTGRHLPAGLVSVTSVVMFTAVSALCFLASTGLFLLRDNGWPIYLSVPVLLFLCAYSYTKRFTVLAHFWLGVSLLLAPVSAWIAIRGMPDWPEAQIPLLLGGAVLFWVSGFDILYACQDATFDREANLKSVPAILGVAGSLRVAAACHLVMLAMLLLLGQVCEYFGWIYFTGVGAVAVLLAWEHWIVRPDDLSRVNQAFFQVNAIISVGLFLLVLVQLAVGV